LDKNNQVITNKWWKGN